MNINWETLERLMQNNGMRALRHSRPRAALLVIEIAMAGLRNRVPDGGIVRDITVQVPVGVLTPPGRTRQNTIDMAKHARAAGLLTWEQRLDGRGHVYTVHVG